MLSAECAWGMYVGNGGRGGGGGRGRGTSSSKRLCVAIACIRVLTKSD